MLYEFGTNDRRLKWPGTAWNTLSCGWLPYRRSLRKNKWTICIHFISKDSLLYHIGMQYSSISTTKVLESFNMNKYLILCRNELNIVVFSFLSDERVKELRIERST